MPPRKPRSAVKTQAGIATKESNAMENASPNVCGETPESSTLKETTEATTAVPAVEEDPEDPLPSCSASDKGETSPESSQGGDPSTSSQDGDPSTSSQGGDPSTEDADDGAVDKRSDDSSTAGEGSSRSSPQTGLCEPAEPTDATLGPDIDPDWVAEEERIAAENERETARTMREVELRNQHEEREARFKRLLRLLNTSQFYVKYLVDKIDNQHEKLKETLEKQKARGKKRAHTEETAEPVRRSGRQANKENDTEPPPAKKAATGRRKRASTRKSVLSSQDDSQSQGGSQSSSQESKPPSQPEPEPEGAREPTEESAGDGTQPRLLTGGTLRDYQLEGYHWLKVMFENGVNCILGDEMGLGKTIQCISLIAYLVEQSVVGPFLVAAPLSTLPNWLSEFERFCPDIPVVLYHGSNRDELIPQIAKFHRVPGCSIPVHPVVLTSYGLIMRDARQLSQFKWRYLIIDEGHRIKNYECRLVQELKRYSSVNRLLLTGTPLQNNLAELWSLLNFLLPEIFDDLAVFESWFDVTSMTTEEDDAKIVAQEREKQVVSTLHKILTPFLLRRVKRDVDLQIPPKRELLVYCPLVEDQETLYKAAMDRTIDKLMGKRHGDDPEKPPELDAKGRPRRAGKEKVNFEFLFADSGDVLQDEDRWMAGLKGLEEARAVTTASAKKVKNISLHLPMQSLMMVLRHVVNHPFLLEHPIDPETKEYLLVPEVGEKSGKMMVLDAMLKRLIADGHKVLIFSQFRLMLDILGDFLTVKGHSFLRLDGSDAVEDRRENIAAFNTDPDVKVFIVSTRAGGLGINLTGADTVIIYDSDWNPQCDLQAQDRAHRIGQTKPVVVYRLVAGGTIDERIVERAAAKRKLEKMVMHSGKFKSGRRDQVSTSLAPVSPEELLQLLRERQHHRVVRAGGHVFTDKEMDQLLDRSDLLDAWNGQKTQMKPKKAAGVFKELEEVDAPTLV
ncbi:lymphocyte-specific helicase-like [Amphibalanus amphitrite]|uniref:lymphocyte-specific helicase-like n=1 Tax=Amphibalanus amphitrite TaxID=1232801 RepID=UPI001C9033B2|nr:lymphocyte-specific helicase-like [Amphibalanus amphitrite]